MKTVLNILLAIVNAAIGLTFYFLFFAFINSTQVEYSLDETINISKLLIGIIFFLIPAYVYFINTVVRPQTYTNLSYRIFWLMLIPLLIVYIFLSIPVILSRSLDFKYLLVMASLPVMFVTINTILGETYLAIFKKLAGK